MTRTITFLVFAFWIAELRTQALQVEALTTEDGLSQGFVPSISQDEDGFLWFATKNGLNRYAGYGFKVFKHNPRDSNSLPNNEIWQVAAMGKRLLAATAAGHFSLFNRADYSVCHLPPFFSFKHVSIRRLIPYTDHSAWISFFEDEVVKIAKISWPADLEARLAKGESAAALFGFEEIVSPEGHWLDLQISHDGAWLWFLGEDFVLQKGLKSNTTRRFPLPAQFRKDTTNTFALVIPDATGAIWVHKARSLARLEPATGVWQFYALPFTAGHFLGLADHVNGTLWLDGFTRVIGIDISKTVAAGHVVFAQEVRLDGTIRSGFCDRAGNIWIGTDSKGIRKFTPRRASFNNYLPGISVYCQPIYDGSRYVFLGDLRHEIFTSQILDLATGQARLLQDFGIYPDFMVQGAALAEDGSFWLFPTIKGRNTLIRLDPATGKKVVFEAPAMLKRDLYIMRAVRGKGELWMFGARQYARFDVATAQFTVFEVQSSSIADPVAAERSPNGVWWIGSNDGLLRFEPGAPAGLQFSRVPPPSGISFGSVKSLLADPADANALWIGFNGQGMSRLDIASGRLTHYTQGLPDDVVYGILADDEQPRRLWLSTNQGLVSFSPETGRFLYFVKHDGLQDNEFNTFAAYKSPGGEMLFGGVNGLTIFHPGRLVLQKAPPEVRFTALRVNGIEMNPGASNSLIDNDIDFTGKIVLPYARNSIVLQFIATDFTAPARNQFAFYLEGAEQEWTHQGLEHSAQYLNLQPGVYRFHVKSANSNGLWNEHPRTLTIVVQAPWYRAWWAYTGYAVMLGSLVLGVYRLQLRRKLAQAEAQRLKELDAFKNRFFTNITHEFRTPLAVILGASEQLAENREPSAAGSEQLSGDHVEEEIRFSKSRFQQQVGLIKRNGENLLRLINQILDLAKVESNALRLNFQQGDVVAYVHYIAESLHSFAQARQVAMRIESDEAAIVMDYDPERLLQIVHNLLSNAIKFTPAGGEVVLGMALQDRGDSASLELTVSDTGTGIPEEDLPYIFDRFFQARQSGKRIMGGTGIGLALTKELVKLLGGSIHVESRLGQGTVFTVHLPVNRKAAFAETSAMEKPAEILDASHLAQPPAALRPDVPKLLLIEDNPDIVAYLADFLKTEYHLHFAFNGRQGIEKALEIVPDIILSDVMMPEKDGLEVCDTLKHDERSSHIPIVLLTARADMESRIAGLRRGADAYLAKPFHKEELLVTLANLLEQRRRWQERLGNIIQQPLDAAAATQPPKVMDADVAIEYEFLEKIRGQIQQHLEDSEFDSLKLAKAVLLSEVQLYRKIKALTGKSTAIYIRSVRLQKGLELLRSTSLTVSEIAYEVGFKDPYYFTRTFTREFGAPPSEMRK